MAKVLHCRDLGFDCAHVVRADTEQEVLEKTAAHAQQQHGLQEIPPEVIDKAKAQIRDEA